MIGVAATFPAHAQESNSGWYVGGGIGWSLEDADCPAGFTCDIDKTAFKIFGGHRFEDYLAVELAASFSGESSATHSSGVTLTGDSRTISAAPLVHVPIDKASILLKFGMHFWEQDLYAVVSGTPISESADGTDPFYGIGVQYPVSENVDLRIEWERYEYSGNGASTDAHGVFANIVFGF